MMLPLGNTTFVSKLVVRNSRSEKVSARLRLERLLNGVDWQVAGLAPSAIVCIRRLRDPLPGSLSLDQRSLHPPPTWQRSVNEVIERLVRRAARPIREAVPADAECVVFSDQAEMLACLSIDWCGGMVGTRWWWRNLLSRLDRYRSILPLWLEAPEYIPGAWRHLANRAKAAEFAARISTDEARAMIGSLAERFALGELRTIFDDNVDSRAAPADQAESEPLAEKAVVRNSYRTHQKGLALPPTPWKSWASLSGDRVLGPEQECLLGIALTLGRAPAIARTSSFADAARRWFNAVKNESRHAPTTTAASRESFDQSLAGDIAPRSERKPESQQIEASVKDARAGESATLQVAEARRDRRVLNRKEQTCDTETFRNDLSANDLEDSDADSRASTSVVKEGERTTEGELNFEPSIQQSAAREMRSETSAEYGEATPSLEAQIETDYGGLFYLLNLGLYLELYGYITTQSVRDIPLDVWDFIALVGERFAGGKLRDDPVWALLAQLAGRDEAQEPGAGCVMTDDWRVPTEWMEPFESDSFWQWTVDEERLRVWHPAGFIALDLPLESGDPADQLRREMRSFAELAPQTARVDFIPRATAIGVARSSLQRWLDCFMSYARVRLQRALGLAEADEVGQALCEYRARVFVSATHMDVMFSLSDSRAEIRLAGLDRDPGWITATGRIIRFHFT